MKRLFKSILVQFFWPMVIIMLIVLIIFGHGWWVGNLDPVTGMITTGTTGGLLVLFVLFCYSIRIWNFDEDEPRRPSRRRRRRNR